MARRSRISKVLAWWFLVGVALTVLAGARAHAEKRVALVIGNSNYTHVPRLPNPRNDAHDISEKLKALDFDVVTGFDVGVNSWSSTMREFERKAANSDVAVFFYAGHALQHRGTNYLMSVDAVLKDETDLNYDMKSLSDIRELLDRSNIRVKIIILDACRDNPLADQFTRTALATSRGFGPTTRGLARIDKPEGLIVVYATAAGKVADDGKATRNSPFTSALLNRLEEPGVEISDLFRRVMNDVRVKTSGRQQPEISVALADYFYLNRAETDASAWQKADDSGDPQRVRDFMKRYPKSRHVRDAERWLELFERRRREDLEQEKRELAAADTARRRAAEEAERARQEELRRAEQQRKADEDRRRQAAEAEEARKREAAEAVRRAEEDRRNRAAEAAAAKKAEEARKLAEAEAAKKAEDDRRRQAAEAAEARKREAAEAARKAAEDRRIKAAEAAAAKKAEEARKLAEAEAAKKADEDRRRQTAEAAEAARREAAEAARKAEEDRRTKAAEAEAAKKAEEASKLAAAEAAKKAEDERRRQAAETAEARKREAAREAAEAARKSEEDRRIKAAQAEAEKRAEEARRRAEAEAAKKADEDRIRQAAEAAAQKKADDARRAAEARARDQEARIAAETRKAEEVARQLADKKAREDEQRRAAEVRKAEDDARRNALQARRRELQAVAVVALGRCQSTSTSLKGPSVAAKDMEAKMAPVIRVQVQKLLADRGFFDGKADGTFNPATRSAISNFQQSISSPKTGYLTSCELEALSTSLE